VTNVPLVTRKLAIIDDHLRRLAERRLDAFKKDTVLQDAIAMGVLVIVQEAMDVAFHIASDEGWELAGTYREAFAVLATHGVIDAPLAASLAGMAQLRNRIAHGYASVDVERLWTELPAGMAAGRGFVAAVSGFLASSSP